MVRLFRSLTVTFVLILVAALVPAQAQTPAAGQIAGRVLDAERGGPLPGASITVDGTVLSTAADATGAFRLVGVPAGQQTLVVTFLGREPERLEITVEPGATLTVTAELAVRGISETVTVVGESQLEGQARALNQQRTALSITNVVAADQIGSFPDPNAAEAASRIPGVSIARDQGEGRYVLVRGTEARLNSMMIDGERIPAPEGDARQVALDAVPADQLQAIEVTKALTPDMDADSIGGAVNLITRQAVGRFTALFSAAGGYNALQRDGDQRQFSGAVGGRLAEGRLGLLVSFSGSALDRGSENFEVEYDDGNLDVLELRDYQVNRERYGVNVTTDVRLSSTDSLVIKGIFNEFRDYEVNNRVIFDVGSERIEPMLKNRQQDQHIRSFSVTGNHSVLGQRSFLDYRLAWAEAGESQPDRLDTIFRIDDVEFSPNVSADQINPDNIQPNPSSYDPLSASLDAWETERFTTVDRDVTGSVNFRTPLGFGDASAAFLKVGAKVKTKSKNQQMAITEAEMDDLFLSDVQDAGFDNSRFLDFQGAGYPKFLGIDADRSRAIFNGLPADAIEVDHEADASTYDATERVYAGYAMAEWYVGPNLTFVPGVRVETTDVDYRGNEVTYDEEGDYLATRPVDGSDRYTFILPGAHLTYAFDDRTNMRASYSRTLARPNYSDLVPYELVIQEDREIERGNSHLQPTSSNNLDLLFEHYFTSVGVVSGGVFYKQLSDYIYMFRLREDVFGDTYEVTQPRNGDNATLWGAEMSLQQRLTFLPGPLDGLGVYLNYTLTDSSAAFPDRIGDSSLPGQSRHLGNISLWYEKNGFMAKTSWNLHGRYIEEVGEDASEDVYYDTHTQLDINLAQQISPRLRVYADLMNLTNAPLRYYLGTTTRPIQEEYYKWWASFGVRVNW